MVERGMIKAFREFLNLEEKETHAAPWKNGRYQQRVRPYGDYLYSQDKDMFMCTLKDTLAGHYRHDDFITYWKSQKEKVNGTKTG